MIRHYFYLQFILLYKICQLLSPFQGVKGFLMFVINMAKLHHKTFIPGYIIIGSR